MVVCKFFQQGNCRYGQNCRFEHIYGSKYSYHSSAAPQAAPTTTDEQLIQQVQSDVQSALRGGQWLLSYYAPFKEKAVFPGLTNMSFEEARLIIYEAKANNTLEQVVPYMNNLFKEAQAKHEQLLLKNSNLTRAFRSIYNGEQVAYSFGNADNSGFGNNSTSVFRSAAQTSPFGQTNQSSSIFSQNNQQPAFGQNTSVFGQTNTSVFAQNNASSGFAQNNASPSIFTQNQNSNIFGPQPDVAKSLFAQASQNTFQQQASAQNVPASIFASASQSVFGQNQPSPFSNQNAFSQNSAMPEASVFGMAQNSGMLESPGFGAQNFQQTSMNDETIYSKMEDLSPDDLEAFNSTDFKMGFIPEIAPPHSLCF